MNQRADWTLDPRAADPAFHNQGKPVKYFPVTSNDDDESTHATALINVVDGLIKSLLKEANERDTEQKSQRHSESGHIDTMVGTNGVAENVCKKGYGGDGESSTVAG
jgi:hypothetical protein